RRSGGGQRFARNIQIARTFDLKRIQVRVSAHDGNLQDGVIEGELCFLGNHRQTAGDCGTAQRFQIGRVERDDACRWVLQAGEQPKQRGLARAVRPENPDDASAGNGRGDMVEAKVFARSGAPVVRKGYARRRETEVTHRAPNLRPGSRDGWPSRFVERSTDARMPDRRAPQCDTRRSHRMDPRLAKRTPTEATSRARGPERNHRALIDEWSRCGRVYLRKCTRETADPWNRAREAPQPSIRGPNRGVRPRLCARRKECRRI